MATAAELIQRFRSRVHVVDGALATELQARGVSIDGPLWSGHALVEQPDAIEQLHFDYLRAGADVIITAGYQVSIAGMLDAGYTEREAEEALRLSVDLAMRARERFLKEGGKGDPLVAASIGPYGAFTADGAEYTGDYPVGPAELLAFHERRFELMAECGPDLLACETTPSLDEARVYARLFRRWADTPGWISFSCKDGKHTCHGEPVADCARELAQTANVVAIGVNCTAPQHIASLAREIRGATDKPIVVYPNSGETWDAEHHRFVGQGHAHEIAGHANEWIKAGANLIGGCCRVGPAQIAALKQATGSPGPS
ncbi:MAG: homocysteine S-methyltransferase [Planctomycetes bacterium]|nr:homocysteine S-methyltransferase [Planctomycetota bacterium]MCW8136901.1 homocysteine S-methyltransferase [Planctomycetota bacterium]